MASHLQRITIGQTHRPIFALVAQLAVPLKIVFRRHTVGANKVAAQFVGIPAVIAEPIATLDAHLPHLHTVFVALLPPREDILDHHREVAANGNLNLAVERRSHVVQHVGLERKGERINCRHILLKPRVSGDDKVKAIARLDSIRTLVVDSGMPFEAAVAHFSEDKNTLMSGGMMTNPNTGATKFEYQDLPPEIARQIYGLNEGEVSMPFVMMDKTKNKEVCVIARLKSKRDSHKANLTDDFQVIRGMLEQQQRAETIENWIKNKQKEIYVHVDPAWRGCDFQYPGWVR